MKKKEVYKVPSCNNGHFAKQLSISNLLHMKSIFLINLRQSSNKTFYCQIANFIATAEACDF